MYKRLRVLIGLAILCIAHAAQAQNIGNTPYSRYGLGEYNYNLGNVRNAGMAGVGISAGNSYQANTANPALLYYNSITIFDMGLAGEVKSVKNASEKQTDSNASLYNLTLVVPVSKRWSAAVGLRPYSTVNYEARAATTLESNPRATIENRYTGEGGLSEIYFSHGVKIADGLTIGGSASYVFGAITKEAASLVRDDSLANISQERVVYSERTRYENFLFRAGANYRKKLNEQLFLSAGAVYGLEANFDAKRKASYERRTLSDNVIDENILPDSSTSSVSVPASLRAGITIDNGKNFTLAADLYTQQWSDFKGFDGRSDLANSYKIAVGGELTPDANSIDNYFKRITYRAGVYYGNSPYIVNGEQIKDKGVTAGFTMPLGRSTIYDMYQLNAALGYGNRGTTDNGLIAENYFQFSVGFTVNSRWFIKRRIE
ncbi:OmpP1/FadL family transporter [Pontibacter sp. MBLB2868]|uniref:OmpP1/FadL family transporter n=1 Tax=Pontibacter sp. MBLB2868 TaxID=3451555 RepID=UPI003F74EE00